MSSAEVIEEAVRAPEQAGSREEERARLEDAWVESEGLWGWLTTVDHKRIARRYIVTALAFFLLAGLNALLMRLQLARPEAGVVGPDLYNQLFTVHGTTMMFLFAVPIMQALGLYFVPLMVGTRNVAFPRLNAFGYWVYLIGGLLLWLSFFMGAGPDAGWFAYVPLSGPEFGPGKRVDVWAQAVTFTEISAIVSAIEIIVTAFKQRAPGMSLGRIPLFVWASVVTSFMVIFAMPTVATASVMLAMDRLIGTHFFNPAEGGDSLLWQHLFWFFAHPEVYIIFLPATGIVSTILPAFTRRPVFGYPIVVAALIATGVVSFGLWVHHMFMAGVEHLPGSLFTAASVLIALPSGAQVFCWIATLWSGRIRFAVPLLFVIGFLLLFVMGGLTGVMVASIPLDAQLHDSYFVVAHFHYVLIGGSLFPLFGGLYYWFPKIAGVVLSERLGRWHFGLFFAGINLAFFPQHFLGVAGMPRRVYTYLEGSGWGDLNLLVSFGAFVIALSVAVFGANVVWSLRRGHAAPADPWEADTLEWAVSSPPPTYGFARIPVITSRSPLWDQGEPAEVVGVPSSGRDVLLTSPAEARPESLQSQPNPTIGPLLSGVAVGVGLITAMFTPWGVVVGMALLLPSLAGWFWPAVRI